MPFPDKDTIALDEEEFDILRAIRRMAPNHRIGSKLAQTYGVWTICFRRYCHDEEIPWLWMSSVSDFMDFLDAHPNVSAPERNRALDGIMFYITDVHEARQNEDESEEERTSVPRSTKSLFAKMLLRFDARLTEALRLRREDVHLSDPSIRFPGGGGRGSRTVSLPSALQEGLEEHVRRVEDRTTSTNPLLFGPHDPQSRTNNTSSSGTEDDLDRSTELATRVLKTFSPREDEDDG